MSKRSRDLRGAIIVALAPVLAVFIVSQLVTVGGEARQQEAPPSRKSIVFDLKTPKVFYCPQEKPADMDKMIVKARPLDKLCEFAGKPRPKNEPVDCYNDVDESDFACDEKKRFMVSARRTTP